MPPLARNVVDRAATAALRAWIAELPGKPAYAARRRDAVRRQPSPRRCR